MIKYLILGAIIILLAVYLYRQDFQLSTGFFTAVSRRLPEPFDGFRIAQISDFHNNHNRWLNDAIISSLKKNSPDIIVITGDLFDKRRTDLKAAAEFVEKLYEIAPIYYISGNHEGKKPEQFANMIKLLDSRYVTVLRDRCIHLKRHDKAITLAGVDSPRFLTESRKIREVAPVLAKKLSLIHRDNSEYSILLAHHPEYLSVYADFGYDLILSGHAHGGQVRVPGIGGLFAPSQGVVPKYTAGEYREKESVLIVSRGIGNSLFPFRINNQPQLVYIDLKNE